MCKGGIFQDCLHTWNFSANISIDLVPWKVQWKEFTDSMQIVQDNLKNWICNNILYFSWNRGLRRQSWTIPSWLKYPRQPSASGMRSWRQDMVGSRQTTARTSSLMWVDKCQDVYFKDFPQKNLHHNSWSAEIVSGTQAS